ncbi:Hypothetical predicted protein [Olea europaea subsp. europaea]|uniref:Uncharacterized protein n=1 Tax=Olea europaea subsp. europaea TaxID=158383 RepID=A0A8S0RGV2_OLEEU|nr:Hypothetical predicted protein [Olea europaea subsp. europaea]
MAPELLTAFLIALLLFNYIHKKSALSDEILLQEAKQKPENETVTQEYAAEEYDSTMSNDFELRSSSISCENSLFSILSDDESSTEVDDEDYLIEIPLPEQVTSLKQGKKKTLDPDELLDLLPESLLEQEGLAQLLSEINGEDNLIEIDVSVGSIRC